MLGGLSAIGAGLYSIGIPKDSIVEYEAAIKSDQFVLVAHGTVAEIERVKGIMGTSPPVICNEHELNPPAAVTAAR